MDDSIGVAEAKQRFSELLDRVGAGERIVIARRGRPAAVLVPPGDGIGLRVPHAPRGFASIVGALADSPAIDEIVTEVSGARRGARDRRTPDLG